MYRGEKSVREGIEDFLCPFEDVYITEGSNESFSHKGILANDIRGKVKGVKYEYFAPCSCKCIKVYKESGQAMYQSLNKVRFANGQIDYATFMTVHDDNLRSKKGDIFNQGDRLGSMGTKGNATGVHCHIEISKGKDTSWFKNKYGNYMFNNEIDFDDACFFDNTNIINGVGNFRKTNDVKLEKKYLNLPPTFTRWRVYDLNKSPIKKNAKGFLNPRKFKGLSYEIFGYMDYGSTAIINTRDYGKCKIYIKKTKAVISSSPIY